MRSKIIEYAGLAIILILTLYIVIYILPFLYSIDILWPSLLTTTMDT